MSYGYEDALARRLVSTPDPGFAGGSGYFSPRGHSLDPSLFDEQAYVHPEVRHYVLDTLFRFLGKQNLRGAHRWTRVWLAGSGITPAWDADRESSGAPGDLDTLLGVDYSAMRADNPGFSGSPDDAIAHWLNRTLLFGLWPSVSHAKIGRGTYELTYYVNSGVGAEPGDLLVINPYAAYDLTGNVWLQQPVEVPDGFNDQYFSESDRALVSSDLEQARSAQEDLDRWRVALEGEDDPARRRNALVGIHAAVRRGAAVFDAIHDGRHAAFAPGGKGYFDVANYRWQAGKGNGAVAAMRYFKQLDQAAHKDAFPGEDDIQHLLLTAALVNGTG